MASPQPTPFVRFSKELFEAFYQNPPDNLASTRLWLWVMRWTWADYGKEETPVKTLGQIGEEVGMTKPNVCRELASLVRCKRLKMGAKGGYAIQKDYDLWRADPKKRARHFGNQPRQMTLEMSVDNPVDKSVDNSKTVTNGVTTPLHRGATNRYTVAQSTITPYVTPIRSKTTVEKGEGATPQNLLPNGKKDTPRNRAELGDLDLAPEDHPTFKTISFKLQDELEEIWKASRDRERKAKACKKKCGRDRAAEGWPYCRPCTVCACGAKADGTKKFVISGSNLYCSACATTRTIGPVKKGE